MDRSASARLRARSTSYRRSLRFRAAPRPLYAFYQAVMRPSRSLRGADREMIAVVVSQTNQCHY